MKKALLALLAVVLAAFAALFYQLHSRPSIEPYASRTLPAAGDARGLRVTFLGVSTLLFRDDSAAVLVDGFFTRPGKLATAFGRIGPDDTRIAQALSKAGIDRLDAVVTVHSHYDHAMDTPAVAMRTGAVVVGSKSTAFVARGQNVPEDRIRTVEGTQAFTFGGMTVTLVPSLHFPHGQAMGELTAPLVPPARATDYLEGGSFSVFVESGGRSVLVAGSAGFVEGALAGRRAGVVYLGIGLLGSKDEAYRDAYWRETVAAVGAKRVIPTHWDDFTRTLDEPLAALPYLFDDLDASLAFVAARAAADGVDVRWPTLFQPTDPFADLEAAP